MDHGGHKPMGIAKNPVLDWLEDKQLSHRILNQADHIEVRGMCGKVSIWQT